MLVAVAGSSCAPPPPPDHHHLVWRIWPMARAVALLCVDLTRSSETGTDRRCREGRPGQSTRGCEALLTEGKGSRRGQE